jgi:urocanate hydratase
LAVDPIHAEAFDLQVARFYASFFFATDSGFLLEPSLGGRFFYAGELDGEARALVVAANIAGAATLIASVDDGARKQAMRDGVVDFLVTTLDEALRILKNEVRKRETVAVCVAQAPEAVEQAMRERGVQPDILRPIEIVALEENLAILIWRVGSAPSLWLPKLDEIAAGFLTQEDYISRRWLRLSPRYLGRLAQGVRVLRCCDSTSETILKRWRQAVECGEIGTDVKVKYIRDGNTEQIIFTDSVS